MERRKWPWRRTAARPIAAAADETTRRRPPQDVCRPRCRRTWWSGVCGPRDALGRSPLLEQNFACAFAKNRDEKSMTAAADSAVHNHHGVDRHRHWTSSGKTSGSRGPCPHIDDRSCISRALPPPRGRSRMVIFWRAWRVGSALSQPACESSKSAEPTRLLRQNATILDRPGGGGSARLIQDRSSM